MASWTEVFRIFKWIDNWRKKGADKNERTAAKDALSGNANGVSNMLKRLFGNKK